MSTLKTMNSFVKQVLAQLTGDQDTAVAQRNYRTSKALVRGQISALETLKIRQEVAVEKAEETLVKTKYPKLPVNDDNYIANVEEAQSHLDCLKDELNDTNHSIEYFEALLVEFDKEVEA